LQDRPDVAPYMNEYVQAFYTLSQQRGMFNSPQAIRFSDIEAYIRVKGTPEGVDKFVRYLVAMDWSYMTQAAKDSANNTEDLG